MSRQEGFEKAAMDYCEDHSHCIYFEAGAEYGYQYAIQHPQWIPVEKELPKENERIIAYNGVFNEIHLCDFHDGIFEDFIGPFDGTITHWMAIMPPRKED